MNKRTKAGRRASFREHCAADVTTAEWRRRMAVGKRVRAIAAKLRAALSGAVVYGIDWGRVTPGGWVG